MLHIKQSPTEIKASAHDQNKPLLRGTLGGQVLWPTKVKNIADTVRGLIVHSQCAVKFVN